MGGSALRFTTISSRGDMACGIEAETGVAYCWGRGYTGPARAGADDSWQATKSASAASSCRRGCVRGRGGDRTRVLLGRVARPHAARDRVGRCVGGDRVRHGHPSVSFAFPAPGCSLFMGGSAFRAPRWRRASPGSSNSSRGGHDRQSDLASPSRLGRPGTAGGPAARHARRPARALFAEISGGDPGRRAAIGASRRRMRARDAAARPAGGRRLRPAGYRANTDRHSPKYSAGATGSSASWAAAAWPASISPRISSTRDPSP